MHLLRTETRTLDEADVAIDVAQTPADIVFLSFSDSDLAAFSAAWEDGGGLYPDLRVASLVQLKHPYSIDLYLAKMASRARFVFVRLLGGLDYWRYGVDELAAAARANGFHLAIVPGDYRRDERLEAASTLPLEDLHRLWSWLAEGGADNLAQCLAFISSAIGRPINWREPQPVAAMGVSMAHARLAKTGAPRALILLYRSILLSADTAPIKALADALAARGFAVTATFVTSLKDPIAAKGLAALLAREKPDVVLNTTAFSGRADEGPGVLDAADAPVFQVILAGSSRDSWLQTSRGLSAADLAMNVVLPEIDGRIISRAISFKAETARRDSVEFAHLAHQPEPSRVNAVADLAAAWTRLRRTPASQRAIACVLSDYPHKGGRAGYALGLDTPASVIEIAEGLRKAGYAIGALPPSAALMQALSEGASAGSLSLALYRKLFAELPPEFRDQVTNVWGDPETDPALLDGAFRFSALRAGRLIVALQPERGAKSNRKSQYHDVNLPPRHAYAAFYLWLRRVEKSHALVHCGAHGTLEWLPGKAVALDAACAPEAVLGPMPLIYPFIVNNPGEAAQAKRRLAAVIIGHLTPPLVDAGSHGAALEIEALFDEYANAFALDPPRAKILARAILVRSSETGLAQDAGLNLDEEPDAALRRLDAWICDLKDMRIADGLHVFGRPLSDGARAALIVSFSERTGRNCE
ncbi:MAG TPA: cobaltochelatase subunit CobN, partial [Beijerinckiaceae bacterium]|nr:cobaltochelatase subunit CobN [Beijerinckiaceae bacterium]